jgi:hypothetical protein
MSFTVTASEALHPANGMAMVLKVLTGAAATQPGATAATSPASTASQAITPTGTGSWVYGAALGTNTTLTAASGTTFFQQITQNSLRYIQLRSTSTTTSGTPVTLGASSATTGLDIALCEIPAASGQTLGEDASSPPGVFVSNAQSLATASFNPPAGTLLVLTLSANGIAGAETCTVADSSGLSLTWTERIKADASGDGYAGVWTARMPGVKAGGMIPLWLP